MKRGILGIGVCTLDILTQVTSFPDKESVEEAESSQLMGGDPYGSVVRCFASVNFSALGPANIPELSNTRSQT